MVNVVHATVGDNDYANVASVSLCLPSGQTGAPINPPLFFEVEMGPNSKEFKALPEFLQKMIEKCHEWKGSETGLPPEDNDPFADS